VIFGLTTTPYVTPIAAPYTPILETENNRNILPPDEIQKITENKFIANNVSDEEALFKKQLVAIAERQQLLGMTQQVNNGSAKVLSPTEIFFNSLSTCTAGLFYEKNNLSSIMGPVMLAHNVIGIQGNQCAANLMTQDGKFAACKFDIMSLDDISDQYMIEGLVDYKQNNTSQKSIRADLSWSAIKTQHCIYSEYPDIQME